MDKLPNKAYGNAHFLLLFAAPRRDDPLSHCSAPRVCCLPFVEKIVTYIFSFRVLVCSLPWLA